MFDDDKNAFLESPEDTQISEDEGDGSAFNSDVKNGQDTKKEPKNDGGDGKDKGSKDKGKDDGKEGKGIVTEFGTFKTPEELAAHLTGIIKENQRSFTDINGKYQKALLLLEKGIDDDGNDKGGKSDVEDALDYELLQTVGGKELVKAFKLIEGKQTQFQKDVIAALTKIDSQFSQDKDKSDASQLAFARSNPGYKEHEAEVNKFLSKNNYDVSQLISIWATDYPELKDFAGNKYLAGYKIWEMLSGKKTKDGLIDRAETGEPGAGNKATYIASPQQIAVWNKLGLTPKEQENIIKSRAAKAARRQ